MGEHLGRRGRRRDTGRGTRVDFAREVRPLLSENCFACHGPDEQARQRGLRLDVQEGPFADRGQFGGPVIVAGNAADSLLFHRITASDAETRMPYRRGLGTSVVPGRDDDALTFWSCPGFVDTSPQGGVRRCHDATFTPTVCS